MAQITRQSLTRLNKEKYNIHEEISGTYSFFERDGRRFMQLDTYGSKNRKTQKKTSQVIQIDQDTALFLFDLFLNEQNQKK